MKLIPELYKNVQNLVPEGAFYKFHDIWRLSTVKVKFKFLTFFQKALHMPEIIVTVKRGFIRIYFRKFFYQGRLQ